MSGPVKVAWSRGYKNRLDEWHSKASVRVEAMRRVAPDSSMLPFAPELAPIVAHHLVQAADPATQYSILGYKLHSYMRFTSQLELKAIGPTCARLGLKETPITISDKLALDGLKIAVDEAHHALCSEDLKDQLTRVVGVHATRNREPSFLGKLRRKQEGLDSEMQNLAQLTFCCVSETLITSTLTKIPADRRVIEAVREVVLDHARDEARHHTYFSHVMSLMWDQLSISKRDFIGPLFADFIQAFLSPDILVELDWLEAARFSAPEATRIVDETYRSTDLGPVFREAAKPTISLMTAFGIIEHPATHDALARAGLIEN